MIYEIIEQGSFLCINSKRLEEGNLSFSEKRAAVTEIKLLDKLVEEDGRLRGWIAYTDPGNIPMYKNFLHLDAQPFRYDGDKIWFMKINKRSDV